MAGLTEKFLAGLCAVCPVCFLGRRMPNSLFGRIYKAERSKCPACRAYDRAQASDKEEEFTRRKTRGI